MPVVPGYHDGPCHTEITREITMGFLRRIINMFTGGAKRTGKGGSRGGRSVRSKGRRKL